jgi:DNA-binding NarL/FixJ family response regulator
MLAGSQNLAALGATAVQHHERLDGSGYPRGLRDEVRHGRLDGESVHGVLRAAGHPSHRREAQPSGLTSREVEVLRLLARGLTTKEIAANLVISPKTAGRHIGNICTKIGVSNRGRGSLFAVTHGLMGEQSKMG